MRIPVLPTPEASSGLVYPFAPLAIQDRLNAMSCYASISILAKPGSVCTGGSHLEFYVITATSDII